MDKNFTFLKIIHNFLRKKWYNSTKICDRKQSGPPGVSCRKTKQQAAFARFDRVCAKNHLRCVIIDHWKGAIPSMIQFEHVNKSYGKNLILNDLNFTIPDGQFVVLIGPSGCGKTTTLKTINRLIEPDSGHIYIDGQDITKVDKVQLRRHIGYVIQQIGLFPNMTVAENICVVPKLLNYDKERCDQIVQDMLKLVGMEAHRNKYPAELSGGQQKRICIARALAADPDYIIFDEAVSGLDAAVRKSVLDLLIRIQKSSGKGFLLITHDIDAALYTSQRIAVMKSGRILETVKYEGDTAVFKSDYSTILINSSLLGIKR